MRFVAVASLLAILLTACGSQAQRGDTALLDFIVDGETLRSDVVLTLGQPSASFEDDAILTYRIGGNEKQGYFVRGENGTWNDTRFSLVLLFDDDGKLTTHSMVRVR
jgi:hypothetical protein